MYGPNSHHEIIRNANIRVPIDFYGDSSSSDEELGSSPNEYSAESSVELENQENISNNGGNETTIKQEYFGIENENIQREPLTHVILIANDGREFQVEFDHALMSNTLRRMMMCPTYMPEGTNRLELRSLSSTAMPYIVNHLGLLYKSRERNTRPDLYIPVVTELIRKSIADYLEFE